MDREFENKRINRLCTISLLEFLEGWKIANINFQQTNHFISKSKDQIFMNKATNFSELTLKKEGQIEHLDKLVMDSKIYAPLFMDSCQKAAASCSSSAKLKRITCQDKKIKHHQLRQIKSTWFFPKLNDEKKESIISEINLLEDA